MKLRHARAVFHIGASGLLGMPIARDARHAVIEGTRLRRSAAVTFSRRENVSAGYFGDVRVSRLE